MVSAAGLAMLRFGPHDRKASGHRRCGPGRRSDQARRSCLPVAESPIV